MPHVARPTYTRTIPAHAEKCTYRGRAAVRWKGRKTKWVYGLLCAKPGRCIVESSRFRIWYTDHENRPRSIRGYADRGASEHRMQELASQAERIHAGLLSPQAMRPRLGLTELLDRWERYIHSNGSSEKGARTQRGRAADVCDGVEAIRVIDLTAGVVLEWIGERRKANRHKGRAFGPSTAAEYIGAVKSFTRWCAVVEKCEPVDVLSSLKRRRPTSDLRINRRALSPSELAKLLSTTRRSEETVYGLTGRERHALYLLACTSGLRAIELHHLTPERFDLVAREVTILRGAKNQKRDVLPITLEVVKAVKPLLSGPLWPNRCKPSAAWWLNGARMIRRDLEAAGIAAVVDGQVFDFHALRGQFATDLDRAGVSLARAQKLMRHSDPKLTSKHYQKPDRAELASEVGKLKRGSR